MQSPSEFAAMLRALMTPELQAEAIATRDRLVSAEAIQEYAAQLDRARLELAQIKAIKQEMIR